MLNTDIEIEKISENQIKNINIDEHSEKQNINLCDLENTTQENFLLLLKIRQSLICSMCFFVLGIGMIAIGFIKEVKSKDPGNGVTCWIIGLLIFIPGAYYFYQFYKNKKNYIERYRVTLTEI